MMSLVIARWQAHHAQLGLSVGLGRAIRTGAVASERRVQEPPIAAAQHPANAANAAMHGAGMQACRHAWCSLQQAATHNGECLTSLWHRPAIVLHCGDIRSGNKRHHKRHKKRHTTVVHAWVPCRVGYHTGHAQSAVPEGSEGRRPLTAITAAVGDCRLHIACCIRSACLRCCNRCADSAMASPQPYRHCLQT